MLTGKFVYQIKSTGYSSDRFGSCQVCHKHVSEVFMQTEQQEYVIPEKDMRGFTYYGCQMLFGHHDCLINARKELNNGTEGDSKSLSLPSVE